MTQQRRRRGSGPPPAPALPKVGRLGEETAPWQTAPSSVPPLGASPRPIERMLMEADLQIGRDAVPTSILRPPSLRPTTLAGQPLTEFGVSSLWPIPLLLAPFGGNVSERKGATEKEELKGEQGRSIVPMADGPTGTPSRMKMKARGSALRGSIAARVCWPRGCQPL
eukprot:CAMPEP_0179169400 /NCGR_PEP_ID=MMETSP0796-20121207/83377_1 /TAXON_ID=73915 /ORGANISM="Pyrodinium bahamense, Strain pbaha01" /LENGTH=166 /DNA_ID=CAMNT_0020872243 /DNA_START=57 /DNA_END=555 /DNA_ORIENTATION=+